MDRDNFPHAPPSDNQSQRRSFGGLGRWPAAFLLTGGLLIGGGVGGFVVASAASAATAAPSAGSGTSHPCPNMGWSSTH